MKYPYIVNYKGEWYPAGTDVPVGKTPKKDVTVEKEVETKVEEIKKEVSYTKTEINRLSTAELKSLAKKEKISGYADMTGGELKKVLIEHFGL